MREEIKAVAWNQSQIVDGSHLLVFAAWDNYTEARIDAVVDQMAAERGGLTDTLKAITITSKRCICRARQR